MERLDQSHHKLIELNTLQEVCPQDVTMINKSDVQSQDQTPKASKPTNSQTDPNKKKQPPFLEREAKIGNIEEIDKIELLKAMEVRFEAGYKRWEKRSKVFELANFSVTLLVIILQLAQVVIFQLPFPPANSQVFKSAIATVLPSLTGALLAIQLKLDWGKKGGKSKKAAKLYKQLTTHIRYRLEISEAGGEATDSIKLWNIALLSENKDIPAFLVAY